MNAIYYATISAAIAMPEVAVWSPPISSEKYNTPTCLQHLHYEYLDAVTDP